MKRMFLKSWIASLVLSAAGAAWASDAATSATAGSSLLSRNGTAAATARYEGDRGFARTDTRSGPVNLARGVAVGVDKDGLSISVSNAVAPRMGPAVATNFSMTLGRDGDVAKNHSVSVARGPLHREATAGGATGTNGRDAYATGIVGGRTDRFGHVEAQTESKVENGRLIRPARVIKKVLR